MVLYAISIISGVSGGNFMFGISTAVVVFVITYILNRKNLIGGGDVKLLFPLLLFAESDIDGFIIGISVSGVLLSVIYILCSKKIFIFRKKAIIWLWNFYQEQKESLLFKFVLPSLGRTNKNIALAGKYQVNVWKQEIPYGIALSCGGLWVVIENLLSR
jgi:Flp pilus assembly protein protease CpaA